MPSEEDPQARIIEVVVAGEVESVDAVAVYPAEVVDSVDQDTGAEKGTDEAVEIVPTPACFASAAL